MSNILTRSIYRYTFYRQRKKSENHPPGYFGHEHEIKYGVLRNYVSVACMDLCRAGIFHALDFGPSWPEVYRRGPPRCRSPPCLRSDPLHPKKLNGGKTNENHQFTGLLSLLP